jgi:hypothetical protein
MDSNVPSLTTTSSGSRKVAFAAARMVALGVTALYGHQYQPLQPEANCATCGFNMIGDYCNAICADWVFPGYIQCVPECRDCVTNGLCNG